MGQPLTQAMADLPAMFLTAELLRAISFPSALRKLALGHVAGDAIDRSYQRSDLLERRRELADAWESYCEGTGAGVIALSERRRSKA